METRYVGLDVHREVLQACILDAQGRCLERHRLDLTRANLEAFIRERLRPQDRVVLEATTNTWVVVDLLEPHVAEVAVSNPLRTRAIAEAKVKTDKVDAEVLAQLLRSRLLAAGLAARCGHPTPTGTLRPPGRSGGRPDPTQKPRPQ